MQNGVRTLSIDIGGSGIKTFVLDEQGNPLTERLRRPTPPLPTPEAVLQELSELISSQGNSSASRSVFRAWCATAKSFRR
jgi:polyphosphate glucokinase